MSLACPFSPNTSFVNTEYINRWGGGYNTKDELGCNTKDELYIYIHTCVKGGWMGGFLVIDPPPFHSPFPWMSTRFESS